jgi:hypothetical protein
VTSTERLILAPPVAVACPAVHRSQSVSTGRDPHKQLVSAYPHHQQLQLHRQHGQGKAGAMCLPLPARTRSLTLRISKALQIHVVSSTNALTGLLPRFIDDEYTPTIFHLAKIIAGSDDEREFLILAVCICSFACCQRTIPLCTLRYAHSSPHLPLRSLLMLGARRSPSHMRTMPWGLPL